MNCCENCIYALYDSVPYGSTNVDYLSGCKKEDEITEQEYEGNVECSKYEACVYEDDMTEMDKLENYLKDNGYTYQRLDRAEFEGEQIIVYNPNGARVWDVVCHNFSYGHEKGLLEAYGNIVAELDYDEVEGYLTAGDIISRLEALQC